MEKMIFDYHTHTTFSHGKGSIEDNVVVALEKGLKGLAISDHGPGHWTYGIQRKNISVMREEIERLKPLYPDLDLYLSVEANIVDQGNGLDLTEQEKADFDFIHAGFHYGVSKCYSFSNFLQDKGMPLNREKLREKNTQMVIKAIEQNHIKILTHPGDKGPFDINEIAKVCEREQVWMEINNRHHHLTKEEIKTAMKHDVVFVISSDAHHPKNVGNFSEALSRAKDAGLDLQRIINIQASS